MDQDLHTCAFCEKNLPVTEFHKNPRYRDGRYKHCKKCHYERYGRDAHFRRTYGISEEQYKEMLKEQNYKCLTCGLDHEQGQFKRLVVDHCHSDKGIRGLLCQGCNMALGSAKDNPETLRKLADYLDDYYGY